MTTPDYGSAFSGVGTSIASIVQEVAPYALPAFLAATAITVGLRIVKKFVRG